MNNRYISDLASKYGVYIMIIVLVISGSFISKEFLSLNNILNIVEAVTLLGMVAGGMALVTYSGQFADLSVPCIMAASGLVTVLTLRFGVVPSIICAIIAGSVIGSINAFVVGKLRANPIVWTLGLSFVMTGLIRVIFKSSQIYPDAGTKGDVFVSLARTNVIGKIPLSVIVMFCIMIIMHFIIQKTKFGRYLKYVGNSIETARLTGVNASRVIGLAFIISSITASIGGIFLASLAKSGAYYYGNGYDFSALTAIVLGGMTLEGGKGSVIGVFGGVFTLGILSNILTLLGMNTFSQQIVKGIVFIVVVWVSSYSARRLGARGHA